MVRPTREDGHEVRMPTIFAALTLLLLGGAAGNAACTCRCVDGQMQALCESLIDPPKVCKPAVCRVLKPAVAPPVVAPSGCRQARVCNRGRDCRWELVCQ
jgi:hypothetical protein